MEYWKNIEFYCIYIGKIWNFRKTLDFIVYILEKYEKLGVLRIIFSIYWKNMKNFKTTRFSPRLTAFV